MSNKYSLIILLIASFGVSNAQNKIISFDNPDIYYEGRINYKQQAAELPSPVHW